MITNDNIQVKDNMQIRLGDDGATDAYLEFNGTNLRFFDSAHGAVVTLTTLVAGGSPTLNGTYDNGNSIDIDAAGGDLDITFAAAGSRIDLDVAVAATVTDAIIFRTSHASGAITDAIDVSDGGITNAINVGANTILGTTAVINFTNFDVAANGDVTIGGALTVSGAWSVDAVAAATAATTLTLDGDTTGGVDIGSISTGGITLGANATLASAKTLTLTGTGGSNILTVSAGDVVLSDGSITLTDADNASSVSITNNTLTTASMVALVSTSATTGKLLSITGNGVTSGDVLFLESSAAGLTGFFLRCYDGAANDFSIAVNGATVIAGSAAGTDALTLTAGDIQLTSGYIDVDAGKIEVDAATDLGSYFKRNQAVTTVPVVEIETTNVADDQPCLLIDHNATGAFDAVQIENDGTAAGLHITGAAAGSVAIDIDVAASATGRAVYGDLGAWLGTGSQGAVELVTDSAATIPAGQLLRLNQQGTGQHAAAIAGTVLYMADAATAPGAGTSYLAYITATNIEALHVDAGRVLMDEGLDIADSGTLRFGAGNDTSITSDGTNTHATITGTLTIGDGGTTNYVEFASSTGAIALVGTARVTKKEMISTGRWAVHTGSAALTQVGTGAAFGWALDSASDESITCSWIVPDNWASGTNITAYVHWVANATANDVIFDLYSLKVAAGELVNAAGDLDSVTDTVAGTAWWLNVSPVITIAAAEFAAGDTVIFRLNRDADNAADTLAVDALVLGLEIQYTANAI